MRQRQLTEYTHVVVAATTVGSMGSGTWSNVALPDGNHLEIARF